MQFQLIPDEILINIFTCLPYPTLSQAMLVSRMWRRVGQDPRLWEKFGLKITHKNIFNFYSILNSPSFSRIQAIEICPDVLNTKNMFSPTEVLKTICRSSIKKLYIGGNDLSMVNPQGLATNLSTLEEVHVHCTNLTKTQIQMLLKCCEEKQEMRILNLSGNNLTGIDQNLKSQTYKINFVQMVLSPWYDANGVKGYQGWWLY